MRFDRDWIGSSGSDTDALNVYTRNSQAPNRFRDSTSHTIPSAIVFHGRVPFLRSPRFKGAAPLIRLTLQFSHKDQQAESPAKLCAAPVAPTDWQHLQRIDLRSPLTLMPVKLLLKVCRCI